MRQLAAFRKGLSETEFIEEQNVQIDTGGRLSHYDRLPGSQRVRFCGVLVNPSNSNAKFRLKEVEEASRALALPVQVVNASGGDDMHRDIRKLSSTGRQRAFHRR